ncbi:hypothetical protein JYT83_00715 [bacterium AH-315-F18]|nr:hypothetical protein [bacterium AH-315-F18]
MISVHRCREQEMKQRSWNSFVILMLAVVSAGGCASNADHLEQEVRKNRELIRELRDVLGAQVKTLAVFQKRSIELHEHHLQTHIKHADAPSGRQLCASCTGSGKITCSICSGGGKRNMTQGAVMSVISCLNCKTSGLLRCPVCVGTGATGETPTGTK